MSTFTVVLLCIQAFWIQNVFSSCLGYGAGLSSGLGLGAGLGSAAIASAPCSGSLPANYGLLSPAPAGLAYRKGYSGAAYGGAGEGNVVVAGELPIAGNTAIAGRVPAIGVVGFGGAVPAAGAVTISGQCACGCRY